MAKDDPMQLTTNGPDIIRQIDQLEKAKTYHEDAAKSIGQQLAEIRDRLNGRARKARSGKFTRRRKATPPEVEPTPLDHARREVVGDV